MYKRGLKLWSINTDSYYEEAKRLYENEVYDYIELYVVPGSIDTLVKWQKLNVFFIIHCPHFAHGFNLAKADKRISNKRIFEEVQKFADGLNVPYIVIHGGIDGDINETAKQLADLKDERALIENKPFIALPNKMGGEFCRGYNTLEIETVMSISGCGFCLDFGHAVCAANSLKVNYLDYIKDFMKLEPKMFHLTDISDITSEYDSHPHLGCGQLNLREILQLLPNDATITFETVKNSKSDLNDFVEDMLFIGALGL